MIDDPVVAAVAPDHPVSTLGGGEGIAPAGVRDRPPISPPRGTGLRGVLERARAQAGFRRRPADGRSGRPRRHGLPPRAPRRLPRAPRR
ncbi:hypothetical protein [Streptomyces cirratus]